MSLSHISNVSRYIKVILKIIDLLDIYIIQGTHGTGKMGQKIPCQGKHREFGNFVKTLNCFAQVVNALILKVKDIAIFAAKKIFIFQKLDRSAKSVLCM